MDFSAADPVLAMAVETGFVVLVRLVGMTGVVAMGTELGVEVGLQVCLEEVGDATGFGGSFSDGLVVIAGSFGFGLVLFLAETVIRTDGSVSAKGRTDGAFGLDMLGRLDVVNTKAKTLSFSRNDTKSVLACCLDESQTRFVGWLS